VLDAVVSPSATLESRKERAMLSRRDLIAKAAVGAAAAVAVGGVVGTAVAATRPLREPTDEPEGERVSTPPTEGDAAAPAPWELVAPYVAGAEIAHGWRLVDLAPVRDGSAVATLQNARGRAHRIHLCANDGTPHGIVYTRRIDLVVMNQGYGDLPTEEHLGQAVAELAHAVAANESRVPESALAALLPHAERVQRFAAANDASTDGRLR
jgi:hypothetical protein